MRELARFQVFLVLCISSRAYGDGSQAPGSDNSQISPLDSPLSAWFAPVVVPDKEILLGEAESDALSDADARKFFLAAKNIKKGSELSPGMLITLENQDKYCRGGANTCHATAAGVFRVVSGGDGYVALRNGKERYTGIKQPLIGLQKSCC